MGLLKISAGNMLTKLCIPPSLESDMLTYVDGLNVVPIGPSQVQNILVTDVHNMGVVTLAGVTMALVPQPLLLEVPGLVQCLKRVL